MATLAQYSASLHEAENAPAPPAREPGVGVHLVGAAIYASVFLLVGIAGLLQAG